jgi:hypothetical protein
MLSEQRQPAIDERAQPCRRQADGYHHAVPRRQDTLPNASRDQREATRAAADEKPSAIDRQLRAHLSEPLPDIFVNYQLL